MRRFSLVLLLVLPVSTAAANPVARHDRPRFALTAPDRFERVAVDDARSDLLDVFQRAGDLPGEGPMVLQVLHLDAVVPQRALRPEERAELRRADAFEFTDRVEHDRVFGFQVETLAGTATLAGGVSVVRWATAVPLDDDSVLVVLLAPAHRARDARALHRAALASIRGTTTWETPARRTLNRSMRAVLSATIALSLAYAVVAWVRSRRTPLLPRTRARATGALAAAWWSLSLWLCVPWRADEWVPAAQCVAFAVTYSVLAYRAARTGTSPAPG